MLCLLLLVASKSAVWNAVHELFVHGEVKEGHLFTFEVLDLATNGAFCAALPVIRARSGLLICRWEGTGWRTCTLAVPRCPHGLEPELGVAEGDCTALLQSPGVSALLTLEILVGD